MPCVPGRKSSAGIAVWLTMKNSASAQSDNFSEEADADEAGAATRTQV